MWKWGLPRQWLSQACNPTGTGAVVSCQGCNGNTAVHKLKRGDYQGNGEVGIAKVMDGLRSKIMGSGSG